MSEKMIFSFSGLIKDTDNIREIEAWGHDAGEFINDDVGGLPMDDNFRLSNSPIQSNDEQAEGDKID